MSLDCSAAQLGARLTLPEGRPRPEGNRGPVLALVATGHTRDGRIELRRRRDGGGSYGRRDSTPAGGAECGLASAASPAGVRRPLTERAGGRVSQASGVVCLPTAIMRWPGLVDCRNPGSSDDESLTSNRRMHLRQSAARAGAPRPGVRRAWRRSIARTGGGTGHDGGAVRGAAAGHASVRWPCPARRRVMGDRDRAVAESAEQVLDFGGALPDDDRLRSFGGAQRTNEAQEPHRALTQLRGVLRGTCHEKDPSNESALQTLRGGSSRSPHRSTGRTTPSSSTPARTPS